jgi:hypothetical protein
MLTKITMLATILGISASILLFIIISADTSRFNIYLVSAQTNDSNVTKSSNNVSKNSMELAMSELAKIHLMAANEALMKGNTTAAFAQMNLAYLQLSVLGTQVMKFMQSGEKGSSSSNSKIMVPDNCIIIQGGILECRDILTGSYSLAR